MTENERKPILHILVVGFHHKKGSEVEFSWPPLPPENSWKYLPAQSLPDGSHNFTDDCVFFTLPSTTNPRESIYGVSCFRQVAVNSLKIITEDLTRTTAQKAVCCLMTLPLFGYVQVKLELIAMAYFDQGDFGNTRILTRAYEQLNSCLLSVQSPLQHLNVGLNVRDLFLRWRHKLLVLFKLFLLQRKVLIFGSPVQPICNLILGLVSMFPGLLARGFKEVACVRTIRPLSPLPHFDSDDAVDEPQPVDPNDEDADEASIIQLPRDASADTILPYATLKPSQWNAPLPIFKNGNVCFPYLSLPYLDLLQDPAVHSFIIGASNVLFKQKRNALADVFVDFETTTIEILDPTLRRVLQLSTEDLRFIDFLAKQAQSPKEGAQGSEVWIRQQFHVYLIDLLRTASDKECEKELEQFNSQFIGAFRSTEALSEWQTSFSAFDDFLQLPVGHPFQSGAHLVSDVKLRIAQSMHNSESGRKLNQAVNQTSKAVGGALSTAKSTFSTWWSSLTTNTPPSNNSSPSSEHSGDRQEEPHKEEEPNQPPSPPPEMEENKVLNVVEEVIPPRRPEEDQDLEKIIQKTTENIIALAESERNERGGIHSIFTV